MNYALGNNATTAPASGWSTFIPMGNDPGVYYVWYMAKGDETHADTVPAGPIKVTISGEVTPTTEPTTAPTSAPDNSGSNHSAPTAAPTHVPRTGDTVNLALLIGMLVLGLLGVSVILIRTVRKRG